LSGANDPLPVTKGGNTITTEKVRSVEPPEPVPRLLLSGVPPSESGQLEGNPGRVNVMGIVSEEIGIDPDLTEGHPAVSPLLRPPPPQ
jgi:hypothetical protein